MAYLFKILLILLFIPRLEWKVAPILSQCHTEKAKTPLEDQCNMRFFWAGDERVLMTYGCSISPCLGRLYIYMLKFTLVSIALASLVHVIEFFSLTYSFKNFVHKDSNNTEVWQIKLTHLPAFSNHVLVNCLMKLL